MTKIKFCGLSRPEDIRAANELHADYAGFVFAPGSRRYVPPERAMELRASLAPGILAVGVFVNESPDKIAGLLRAGAADMAQLHGSEDEAFIRRLQKLSGRPVIKAFQMKPGIDAAVLEACPAEYILLDSGAGTGTVFDWGRIPRIRRPYFLAGGLHPGNAGEAVSRLHPFALDVSSGIETDGIKDKAKMTAFAAAVRKENRV